MWKSLGQQDRLGSPDRLARITFWRKHLMRMYASLLFCALVLTVAGCGRQPVPERFKREITPEIAHAESMRSLLNSLRDQLKAEGIPAIKNELAALEERLEEFKGGSVGESNRATYDAIIEKLKSLASTVQNGKMTPPAV